MWNSSSQLLKNHYCPPNKPIFSTSPSKIKYWVIIFCQLSWVLESHILLWYLRFFSFLKSQFYSFGNSMIPIENTWQWIQIIQKNILKKKTKTAVFQISHTYPSLHDYRDVNNINEYNHFMYSMSHFSYLGILKIFSQLI